MIDSSVRDRIMAELSDIETSEDAKILYACESGSRAWGFASEDSDYDVRFIYLRPPEWYLSVDLEARRDVIERPIDDVLDVSGWDLRKALMLMRKSNPPLVEWLGSPIIYLEEYSAAGRMRELLKTYYQPVASGYHYLHMAQGNYRQYLKGDVVWRKKYFYVLRPLLAIQWIEAGLGVVPTEFGVLVDRIVGTGPLRSAIDDLVEEKARGGELDRGPRVPAISDFIDVELERLEGTRFARGGEAPPIEPLNAMFRESLDEVFARS